jgi:hypothetical protein
MEAWRVASLLLLLACAAAVTEDDTVTSLDDRQGYAPRPTSRLTSKEMDEVDKVGSIKDMMRKIAREVEAPQKKIEEEEEGDGTAVEADIQREQVAIGNTLRTMEAKAAVKEELVAETPVDCEMGVWSDYGKCSKMCGGGKKRKSRSVVRQAANGGSKCGELLKSINCNTESCGEYCQTPRVARVSLTHRAQLALSCLVLSTLVVVPDDSYFAAAEEAEEYAKSRTLTEAEHKSETAVNNRHAASLMASDDVETMVSGLKTLMRNMVKTDVVVVKLPGALPGADPVKYEVNMALKDAIAKNTVSSAMANMPGGLPADPTQAEVEAAGDGGSDPVRKA